MSKMLHLSGGGGAQMCVSVCVMWCGSQSSDRTGQIIGIILLISMG